MNAEVKINAEKEGIKESVKRVIGYALQQGHSIAMWRLPNNQKIYLLLSADVNKIGELTIEEIKPGFVISPFLPDNPKFFFEASHLFDIEPESIEERTPGQISELAKGFDSGQGLKFHIGPSSKLAEDKDDFIALIKASINAIEAGSFEKVVPSQKRAVPVSPEFDLLDSFDRLSNLYPAAMVSLISDPNVGTWMGASPELLVSTDKKGIFRTIALAGTQRFQPDVPMRNISWTQKEIEEQALVERYVISCFKKIRVREYEEHGPKTVQAGNLIHLRSDFEVDMKEVNYPQLGSVMLKLLHPTSAVCGMPLGTSMKFLAENEMHDREYYTGFLGPVNIDNESHLYVNLRCLKWCSNEVHLFAGAGITIDSVPEDEFEEVEIKFQTISKALNI